MYFLAMGQETIRKGVMFMGAKREAFAWIDSVKGPRWSFDFSSDSFGYLTEDSLGYLTDDDCGMPVCNLKDRVAYLLNPGEASDKNDLFVENGYRVTGVVDTDYTSFVCGHRTAIGGSGNLKSEIEGKHRVNGVRFW